MNYFASSDDFSTSASINLAMPDDGTIIEWLKDRSEKHRNASFGSDPDSAHADAHAAKELARERFVSLADIVLFRTRTWCSLWESEWSYRMMSEELNPHLKRAVQGAKNLFEQWAANKGDDWAQQISYRRAVFDDIEYAISNHDFTRAGEVPLMNKLGEHLFGTASSDGQVRLRREIREADLFATVVTPVEGHSRGFWVFAHNTMKPWQDDGFEKWGSQVFAKNERRALLAVSRPALRELTNRESERVQFHCYFVDPAANGAFSPSSIERIKHSFQRHYPNYVFNALLQFSR